MKKIGYAVIGLGVGMAHVHAAAKSANARLVAVCDLVESKLAKVKELYPDTLLYTDFDEMLKNPDIEIISIALPSGMHADFAVRALEAGKHILSEKPIDITPEAAMKIEEARVRTGKKAAVVFQCRNHGVMKAFKKAIDDGRLGKLFLGTFEVKWYRSQDYYDKDGGWRGTWAMDGGGSLMNQAVHTLDLMQWLMGDVASVSSQIGVFDHDIETEDLTASVFRFKNGAVATFVSTTCCEPSRGTIVEVYGTNGSLEADGDVLKLWKIHDAPASEEEEMMAKYAKGNASAVSADPSLVFGHASQVNDLVDAVIEGRDPQIMPLEAIKAVRIINAVYESAKTGKTVYLD